MFQHSFFQEKMPSYCCSVSLGEKQIHFQQKESNVSSFIMHMCVLGANLK